MGTVDGGGECGPWAVGVHGVVAFQSMYVHTWECGRAYCTRVGILTRDTVLIAIPLGSI